MATPTPIITKPPTVAARADGTADVLIDNEVIATFHNEDWANWYAQCLGKQLEE